MTGCPAGGPSPWTPGPGSAAPETSSSAVPPTNPQPGHTESLWQPEIPGWGPMAQRGPSPGRAEARGDPEGERGGRKGQRGIPPPPREASLAVYNEDVTSQSEGPSGWILGKARVTVALKKCCQSGEGLGGSLWRAQIEVDGNAERGGDRVQGTECRVVPGGWVESPYVKGQRRQEGQRR